MRLILTLFALLFTQLFFNLRTLRHRRVLPPSSVKAMLMKRGPMTAEKKADKAAKSQSDGPEKNQDRQGQKREKREKIVSAKPKAKAQKTAKIKVTPPKKGYKRLWSPPRSRYGHRQTGA